MSQIRCALGLLWLTALCEMGDAADPKLQLATFTADMTPEIGQGPCIGFMSQIDRIEHPLELRGVILWFGGETCVLAALDYNGLCNSSDDRLRRALADAAETTPDKVALQSLHQHSAPVLDLEGVERLYGDDSPQARQHREFTEVLCRRIATAVQKALPNKTTITSLVGSRAKAERLASNRRVPQADGTLAVRGSATKDPKLHTAPEGLIDPWVRTVTFFSADVPLVQLHYYATHPMSFYGDARISWDVPGIARQKLQDETGVLQIYFNGCGGNLGMGKYNDGTRTARDELSARLYQALKKSAAAATGRQPAVDAVVDQRISPAELPGTDIAWDAADLKFSVRDDGPFHPAALAEQLQPAQPLMTRLKAAEFSAWKARLEAGHLVKVPRLKIGAIQIVHLPGEPFVEFQLFAQQAAPDAFVCVAGYGECGVWYYGPDSIFTDRGGYEQTWSFTGPCQVSVESLLTQILRAKTVRP